MFLWETSPITVNDRPKVIYDVIVMIKKEREREGKRETKKERKKETTKERGQQRKNGSERQTNQPNLHHKGSKKGRCS
jgi:hypothetical protein